MSKHYLQEKITGTQGQWVGFDTNGNAIAQNISGLDERYILASAKAAANGVASLGADSKVPVSQLPVAAANGVASLGADGKVPSSQLPVYNGSVVIS